MVNINSSGNIEWAQKINKRQVSRNDGGPFSSFAMAVVKDKLYFIFNDNKENLTNKEGKTSNFSLSDRKGIVTVVTMNQDGTSTRSPLYTNEEIEVLTRPKVCRQINDSEMLLFGERKKTDQFALLKFIN